MLLKRKLSKKRQLTVEYDMEDDLNALVEGEELSEENQGKAKTIFEAAINSKVTAIRAEIQEEYDSKLMDTYKKLRKIYKNV